MISFIKKNIKDIRVGGLYTFKRKVKFANFCTIKLIKKIIELIYKIVFFPFDYPRQKFFKEQVGFDFMKIFINDKEVEKKDKIKIYSVVYGKHVLYLDQVLLKSVFQSNNIPAILNEGIKVELRIFTVKSDYDKVKNIIINKIEKLQLKTINLSFNISVMELDDILIKSRNIVIVECKKEKSALIMAMSDFYFGNSSLLNLVKIGLESNSCIAGMHLRVNDDDFIKAISSLNQISNSELVDLSMKYKHQNTTASFHGAPTGFKITQLNNYEFIVEHRLPNVWFANFTKKDYLYFKERPFQAWDHQWPTSLIFESRYKVIGSTDIFYVAELTENDSHIVELENNNIQNTQKNYDNQGYLHKEINNIFLICMKSNNKYQG